MSKLAATKTDWRARRDAMFAKYGLAPASTTETEQPFSFVQYHAVQEPREKYVIKNPCPWCGGRMFPDWIQREGWRMKCLCCSREVPINFFERSVATKKGMEKAKGVGRCAGRPKEKVRS